MRSNGTDEPGPTLSTLASAFRREVDPSELGTSAELQEIAFAIEGYGDSGRQLLLAAMDDPQSSRAQAAILALGASETPLPHLRDRLVQKLSDVRPFVVAAAINALQWRSDREPRTDVEALADHFSPYVRAAVLEYMTALFSEDADPYLDQGFRDISFIVREAALDALDNAAGEQLASRVPHEIWGFLEDPHADVRQAAQSLLDSHYWKSQDESALREASTGEDIYRRASALRHLVQVDRAQRESLIKRGLGDPAHVVRLNTIDAFREPPMLWELSPADAHRFVDRFLTDGNGVVRTSACEAAATIDLPKPNQWPK